MTTFPPSKSQDRLPEILLDHLERYRLTVPAAVKRLPGFQNMSRKRLRALLREMCRTNLLYEAPLYGNRTYLARASERSPSNGKRYESEFRPFSESAKIRHYALLAFCCLGDHPRKRLTAAELQQHFPSIARPDLSRPYYVDTTAATPRLGVVRVDGGGRGRWDRVLAKCRADWQAHETNIAFRPFLEAGRFEITLITALPQKAARLCQSLHTWPQNLQQCFRIVTVPDLIHLIAPPPRRADR